MHLVSKPKENGIRRKTRGLMELSPLDSSKGTSMSSTSLYPMVKNLSPNPIAPPSLPSTALRLSSCTWGLAHLFLAAMCLPPGLGIRQYMYVCICMSYFYIMLSSPSPRRPLQENCREWARDSVHSDSYWEQCPVNFFKMVHVDFLCIYCPVSRPLVQDLSLERAVAGVELGHSLL